MKRFKKKSLFQDSRDIDQIISTNASVGQGFIEDIVNNPKSSYHKIQTLIKTRQEYPSLRDIDENTLQIQMI